MNKELLAKIKENYEWKIKCFESTIEDYKGFIKGIENQIKILDKESNEETKAKDEKAN